MRICYLANVKNVKKFVIWIYLVIFVLSIKTNQYEQSAKEDAQSSVSNPSWGEYLGWAWNV